ncbi:MAG: hypothetical protein LBD28_01690 [Tannerellaceae bacterium]|jgi:methylmalonyl-CoA mutase cobalamin-binding subunit|nr:hypothetical protein [Tannerellaceae bacterium]
MRNHSAATPGRPSIILLAGGAIPAQDYDLLYKAGAPTISCLQNLSRKAAKPFVEIFLD